MFNVTRLNAIIFNVTMLNAIVIVLNVIVLNVVAPPKSWHSPWSSWALDVLHKMCKL